MVRVRGRGRVTELGLTITMLTEPNPKPNPNPNQAPWVTELGWTIVPPCSDPQQLHADIVAENMADEHHRSLVS